MAEPASRDGQAGCGEADSCPFAPASPVDRVVLWTACAALVAGFLGLDFLLPLVINTASAEKIAVVIICFLAGCCIGQVNLIATWAVLAPGNLVVRLPWALLLGMLMWLALVCGIRQAERVAPDDVVLLGVVLLAGSVFLQIPLWIAKRVFAWRMIREGNSCDAGKEDRQFDLRQMLLGTLLFALALAPVRFLLPPGTVVAFRGLYQVAGVLGVAFLCNLAVTVPCIWGGLILSARLVPVTLGWLCYCLLLTVVEIALLSALGGPPPASELLDVCSAFYLLNITQCATVFGTLRLFRRLGFRLLRWRALPSPSDPSAPAR